MAPADSLAEIQAGDQMVKIFATSFSSGNATASKIIVHWKPKETVLLRGAVENVPGVTTVTVLKSGHRYGIGAGQRLRP